MGLTFKCLNLEYLCSVSPLYKYARLYADYAKILQHSFKSVLLLDQCYKVAVTYLKIGLDWGEKKQLFLLLRPSADGTRGTGGSVGNKTSSKGPKILMLSIGPSAGIEERYNL